MSLAHVAKLALRSVGLEVSRYRPASSRRIALMSTLGVRTVVDVGANFGQYGIALREAGFNGAIISFEPLHDAFVKLLDSSSGDTAWTCHQLAASDQAGSSTIHVAGNSASSSLLVMAAAHYEAAPDSIVVGTEAVTLSRLDEVEELRSMPQPLMLKLDVQGHEHAALDGAAGIVDRVVLVEAELSIHSLYENSPLLLEMLSAMDDLGFDLVALEPGFYDPRDGRILQFDGFFKRREAAV